MSNVKSSSGVMAKLVSRIHFGSTRLDSGGSRPRGRDRPAAGTDGRLGSGDTQRPDQGDEKEGPGQLHGDQVVGVERLTQSGDVGLGPTRFVPQTQARA